MPHFQTEDFGITVGEMPKGKLNNICDVKGIKVGHVTIDNALHKTGVTVILPSKENPFSNKLPAACKVFNGFGKTLGTIQIDELGTIETPIALTNTLNVGLVHDAIVDYMVQICNEDGTEMHSINPIVAECNDGRLNKITERVVTKEHVYEAIENAEKNFELGSVGAGRGMICHGLKGGIGSASRVFKIGNKKYTLGVLVLSNHGRLEKLQIDGRKTGKEIIKFTEGNEWDKGSCIIIMATDLPLDSRQIKRVISRASVGLARLGSFIGSGSGEVAIGFSTENKICTEKDNVTEKITRFNESNIDIPFVAMAEATEEAILRSMINSVTTEGYDGTVIHSITEYIEKAEEI